ncbi:hypothetical protein [uncultured Actinomyces sp.]|uniref:hypothetical protein n=1 Tax=uncultured Actinomyces sp. TaxID=249061 RepID=UPI0028E2FB30|nr:hypothetical protein [uncultured Actinomyces sp.]
MGRSSGISIPTDWWAAGLSGCRGLFEVFNRRPASLEGAVCLRVRFVNFDDVRLVVELADAPDPLPARWVARGNDALRLRMQLAGVLDLHVHGHPNGPCSIEVTTTPEGLLTRTWNPTYEARILSHYASLNHMEPFHRHASGTLGREEGGSWDGW